MMVGCNAGSKSCRWEVMQVGGIAGGRSCRWDVRLMLGREGHDGCNTYLYLNKYLNIFFFYSLHWRVLDYSLLISSK